MKNFLLFPVLFLGLLAGCANDRKPGPMAAFGQLAEQYRTGNKTNQIALAKRIVAVLPTCPIHRQNWGMEQWNDWQNPSYKLCKTEIVKALGQPNQEFALASLGEGTLLNWVSQIPPYRWGPTSFVIYDLGRDTNATGWELVIALYHNYAVAGAVETRDRVESSKHMPNGQSLVVPGSIQ
jgi:hypothetical protein